jgi:hypothetical protein
LYLQGMKRCPDCGLTKSFEEFPKNKRTKDGVAVYCKPCHNARGRETRQRLYGGSRHYHLKRRYGIGADEVDALVEAQGGLCVICGRPDPEHVDHDHTTGIVRGILCFNCNGGLGQFGDDTDRLASAMRYLDAHACDDTEVGLARERARLLGGVA